jgi:transposase
LTSVVGIGPKTALFLIIVPDGFSTFETASQLCSYVGITLIIRESGSSVRDRARISKIGNKVIKQCFAIAKSGRPYDEKYVSVLPR